MKASQIAELLKGKVVKEVKHGSYLGWNMTIGEIVFEDGTVLSLSGNADHARADSVQMANGDWVWIDSDKDEED